MVLSSCDQRLLLLVKGAIPVSNETILTVSLGFTKTYDTDVICQKIFILQIVPKSALREHAKTFLKVLV